MSTALDALLEILDLEELEVNLFRGRSPQEGSQRVFGGQVPGRRSSRPGAPSSAARSHSFHAYFLRPGDPATPILYQVDRMRDGRTFTTRRVVAIQRGRAIFHLEASFQPEEPGPEHQERCRRRPIPRRCRPGGSGCAPYATQLAGRACALAHARAADRDAPRQPFESDRAREAPAAPARLDPRRRASCPRSLLLHQCVVAYASDLTLLDTAALPHAIAWTDEG